MIWGCTLEILQNKAYFYREMYFLTTFKCFQNVLSSFLVISTEPNILAVNLLSISIIPSHTPYKLYISSETICSRRVPPRHKRLSWGLGRDHKSCLFPTSPHWGHYIASLHIPYGRVIRLFSSSPHQGLVGTFLCSAQEKMWKKTNTTSWVSSQVIFLVGFFLLPAVKFSCSSSSRWFGSVSRV